MFFKKRGKKITFRKKSYFLSIDAFVAIGVVIFGLIIIYSQYGETSYDTQHQIFAKDILDSFSLTIPEYNVNYYKVIGSYKQLEYFEDYSLTLDYHIARFVVINGSECVDCFERAKNLTFDVVNNSLANLQIHFLNINVTIYNLTNTFILYNNSNVDIINSKTIATHKKLITVVENDEFHPFIMQVVLWN
jgi:hypothetical protein